MGRQGLPAGQGSQGLGSRVRILAGSVARGCAAGWIGNRDSSRFRCAGLRGGVVVWVKTLHQDYGRKEESRGFRRADYCATSGVYNTGGLSPSDVVPFLSSLRNLCS